MPAKAKGREWPLFRAISKHGFVVFTNGGRWARQFGCEPVELERLNQKDLGAAIFARERSQQASGADMRVIKSFGQRIDRTPRHPCPIEYLPPFIARPAHQNRRDLFAQEIWVVMTPRGTAGVWEESGDPGKPGPLKSLDHFTRAGFSF